MERGEIRSILMDKWQRACMHRNRSMCRDGAPMSLFYSTSPTLNRLNADRLRVAVLQSAELDDDRDGRPDRLEISLLMPLGAQESVAGLGVLLYHDVTLSAKARYQFDAVTFLSHEGAAGLSSLAMDGDLLLRQTWPLVAKGGSVHPALHRSWTSLTVLCWVAGTACRTQTARWWSPWRAATRRRTSPCGAPCSGAVPATVSRRTHAYRLISLTSLPLCQCRRPSA